MYSYVWWDGTSGCCGLDVGAWTMGGYSGPYDGGRGKVALVRSKSGRSRPALAVHSARPGNAAQASWGKLASQDLRSDVGLDVFEVRRFVLCSGPGPEGPAWSQPRPGPRPIVKLLSGLA